MKKINLPAHLLLFLLSFFPMIRLIAQNDYSKDYIIVRLNHKLLDFEKIDNPDFDNKNLMSFLNGQGKIELEKSKDSIANLGDLNLVKLFPNHRTKDSISISRMGKQVYIPPFWATFKIEVPKTIDYWDFFGYLKTKYPIVIFVDPPMKIVYEDLPNDSLFNYQQSLYDFSNPNVGINLDSAAWNIESGKKFIKVGVFDSGIDSSHEDLEVLTGHAYYYDLAYDSTSNAYFSFGQDLKGHGTLVAGIIGAKRNNQIGIAGIAGGNGTDDPGVSLLDFSLGIENGGSPENFSQAIIDAARSVGTYYNWNFLNNPGLVPNSNDPYWNHASGYGINIGNHSYSYIVYASPRINPTWENLPGDTLFWEPIMETPFCNLCRESFLFSLQNGVVNVVSRANNLNMDPALDQSMPNNRYPQKFDDSWIISVGASGTDGKRLVAPFNTDIGENFKSPIGLNLDIIAPGSRSNVVSTRSTNLPNTNIYGSYRVFNGTSAAAPHASGVAALLLSHYNKPCYSNVNLDPADVEYILQKSATDVNPYVSEEYDDSTGFGRLNALKALEMIDFPTLQIVHPNEPSILTYLAEIDTISIHLNRPLNQTYGGPIGSQFPLELNSDYRVERRKYVLAYDISPYIQSNTELLDTWIRHSETNSLGFISDTVGNLEFIGQTGQIQWISRPDTFGIEPNCYIDTIISNSIILLSGYYYHFIKKHIGQIEDNDFSSSNIDFWYPINPNVDTLNMAFSLYIKDTTIDRYDFPCYAENPPFDTLLTANEILSHDFNIYPNPSNGELNIIFENLQKDGLIEIFDISGQLLFSKSVQRESKTTSLDATHLSTGVYLVKFSGQEIKSLTKKWIKL
jgi:subtilisin family serine protease